MSQPGEIVLVSYPYDDLTSQKIRPALCLTKSIGPYRHVVLSVITSKVLPHQTETEVLITNKMGDFAKTGLKVSSTIQLHRLMSVPEKSFKRKLGTISSAQHQRIKKKVLELFEMNQ